MAEANQARKEEKNVETAQTIGQDQKAVGPRPARRSPACPYITGGGGGEGEGDPSNLARHRERRARPHGGRRFGRTSSSRSRPGEAVDSSLEIESKVGSLYGTSIRDLSPRSYAPSASTRSRRCRSHRRIAIRHRGEGRDCAPSRGILGALASRASRRDPEGRLAGPPSPVAAVPPRERTQVRGQAGIHHPDAVILDLEDSVHPDEKDAARFLIRNPLRCIDFLGAERMVRVNQLPLGYEDLEGSFRSRPI